MEARRLYLGLDYGTSASKLIVRDYEAAGGDRADVVPVGAGVRHPADVVYRENWLLFGDVESVFDDVVYSSLKMRVAAEAAGNPSICEAPQPDLPAGLTAKDLATLSVWQLLGVTSDFVGRELRPTWRSRTQPFSLYTVLGIPFSFFTSAPIRQVFLDVVLGAELLLQRRAKMPNPLPVCDALLFAKEAAEAWMKAPEDLGILRQKLRPEAEAALWWSIQSPAIKPGCYLKVDPGAGTTNVSYFRIVDEYDGRVSSWLKRADRLVVFGAASVANGMDGIDTAIADALGEPETLHSVRGKEVRHLEREPALVANCQAAFERSYAASRLAWKDAYTKLKGAVYELRAWKAAQVFMVGGGSAVPAVCEYFRRQPAGGTPFATAQLDVPTDLYLNGGRLTGREMQRFVAVAYGLANSEPLRSFVPSDFGPTPETPSGRPAWNASIYEK